MFAAIDPFIVAPVGAVGVIVAAWVTGRWAYKAAVAKTKDDREVAEQARTDTTAAASAFDMTIKALAGAAAEATQRALEADAKADRAIEGEGRCRSEFAAHQAATTAEIATLRGALSDLAQRITPGAA